MVYRHEDTVEEGDLPLEALDAWLGWYDTTPDTPLHCHLLHQPGRRSVQGLWPHVR